MIKKFVYIVYKLDQQLCIYFVLENLDKIMHLRFNFDACPMHSPYGFVHLTHQNFGARALFLSKFTRKSKYAVINL